MSTEQQKLEAAMDIVSNSLLHGWTTEAKISYIKQILPDHYIVKESKEKGSVHCKSSVGIEDEEQWGYFISALEQRFKNKLYEVFHNTNHNHADFTVYLKP